MDVVTRSGPRLTAASFYLAILILEWIAFAVVVGPALVSGATMQPVHAMILFPLLVVSVGVAGVTWSRLGARADIEPLGRRVARWRVPASAYLGILVPPVVIFFGLRALAAWQGPGFAPGFFVWGFLIGLFPGFCEELGWMGYLFPRLRLSFGALPSALLLGVLWAVWHLPVVNYLGAAGPHGAAFPAFFAAFAAVLVALRVIMVWIYERTHSVLLMQLMHASSTGSLIVLSPPHISAAYEAQWYALYALALALLATVLVSVFRISPRAR